MLDHHYAHQADCQFHQILPGEMEASEALVFYRSHGSIFNFPILFALAGWQETNTVYFTQLISLETTFLSILFPTIRKLIHGCIVLLTSTNYSEDNKRKSKCSIHSCELWSHFERTSLPLQVLLDLDDTFAVIFSVSGRHL